MRITVQTGEVKFFPEGSYRDAPSMNVKEGESVELEALTAWPVALTIDTDGELADWMKKQVNLDASSPCVGTASSKENRNVEGWFTVDTEDTPILARIFYAAQSGYVMITPASPLSLKVTETNAVTVMLYGVKAAEV